MLLAIWLAGCAPKIELSAPAEFPAMTPDQVEAAVACRAAAPVLDEWWVRYVKAWQKANAP